MTSSNGAGAKLDRAKRQLQNTQVLINSLPKVYYLNHRETIRDIERDIDDIIVKIESKLYQK